MRLILIIAAGILLAFILLPFLGTIVMALIAVVVFAALIYGLAVAIPWLIRSIFIFIAVGKLARMLQKVPRRILLKNQNKSGHSGQR